MYICVRINFLLRRFKVWRPPPLAIGVLRQCFHPEMHARQGGHVCARCTGLICLLFKKNYRSTFSPPVRLCGTDLTCFSLQTGHVLQVMRIWHSRFVCSNELTCGGVVYLALTHRCIWNDPDNTECYCSSESLSRWMEPNERPEMHFNV